MFISILFLLFTLYSVISYTQDVNENPTVNNSPENANVTANNTAEPANAQANVNAEAKPETTTNEKADKKPETKWYDKMSFEITLFAHYGFTGMKAGEKSNINDFNIYRTYLDFKTKPVDKVQVRATTDISTKSDAARYLFMKYAYASYSPFKFLAATFGLQPTPWVAYVVGWSGYRILDGAIPTNYGVQSTSDVGFSISSGFKKKEERIADMIDFWIGLLNGGGYKAFEKDKASLKNFSARIGVTPLDNSEMDLGIGLAYTLDFNDKEGDNDDVDKNQEHIIYSLVHFHLKELVYFHIEGIYGMYKPNKDDTSLDYNYMIIQAFFAVHAVPDLLDVVGRFDYSDPTDKTNAKGYKDDVDYRAMGGINYKVDKKMLWVIPNVAISWKDKYDTSTGDKYDDKFTDVSINVDVQAKF